MAKETTIKIPTTEGFEEARGQVCYLQLGVQKHKFFLQKSYGTTLLTDYASGYQIGDLRPIKIRAARSYKRLTNRAAAEILLQEIIERHGVERLLDKLNEVERINP